MVKRTLWFPIVKVIFFSEALRAQGRLEEFISVPGGQHGPVTFNENTLKKMIDFFCKRGRNIERFKPDKADKMR